MWIILRAHRYEAFRFKKSAEKVFTGGPEHAISYAWQLASDVAIIYPDSRFHGHLKVSKALLPCHGIFRNFWESMGGERNAGYGCICLYESHWFLPARLGCTDIELIERSS
jgi:hypothetical protein